MTIYARKYLRWSKELINWDFVRDDRSADRTLVPLARVKVAIATNLGQSLHHDIKILMTVMNAFTSEH